MTVLVFAAAATFTGVAVLGLAGCAQPATAPGSGVPVATTSQVGAPVPTTEVAAPPVTVVVAPPVTVTAPAPAPAPRKPAQTPCQRLAANGYSYAFAVQAWLDEGLPANWDADHDGYPCEQSYGDQN